MMDGLDAKYGLNRVEFGARREFDTRTKFDFDWVKLIPVMESEFGCMNSEACVKSDFYCPNFELWLYEVWSRYAD